MLYFELLRKVEKMTCNFELNSPKPRSQERNKIEIYSSIAVQSYSEVALYSKNSSSFFLEGFPLEVIHAKN